jgi:lipopolysaccharide biosynthesis glycosyltransferase
MKPLINILFSCDTNYAIPMTVCITSIFENNKENQIDIYILYSSLSEQQKKILIDLANQYNQNINLIPAPEYYFSTAPTLRWTKETYYRLLLNELLPQNLHRIIYIDCDTIVINSLLDLFNLNLGEYYIAALLEEYSLVHRKRLGLKEPGDYYQAGVLLFDLNKCRTILNYDKATEIINFLGEKLKVVDQDVINFIFDGKIKSLDKKFNNCELTNFEKNNFKRLFNIVNKKELRKTVILHYAASKPWNNIFSGSCEGIWYKYLKISPYSSNCYKKFKKVKYKLIRLGIFKLLFFYYIKYNYIIDETSSRILPSKLFKFLKNYYRKNIK